MFDYCDGCNQLIEVGHFINQQGAEKWVCEGCYEASLQPTEAEWYHIQQEEKRTELFLIDRDSYGGIDA